MSRILVFTLLLFAVPARATVVEVPLPGLLGVYDGYPDPTVRTVVFQLADPPGVVYGASIRVSGTTEVGTIVCEATFAEWPAFVGAQMVDTPPRSWSAYGDLIYVAGAFTWTEEFTTSPAYPATWSFLSDGTGEISMHGGGAPFITICSEVSEPPAATVTEAVLIIDGEFPIRTEPTTWGRIKALYRE